MGDEAIQAAFSLISLSTPIHQSFRQSLWILTLPLSLRLSVKHEEGESQIPFFDI